MKNKNKSGKISKKLFANILLFAMFFNIFSFKIFAQENILSMDHPDTSPLYFWNFSLNLKNTSVIDNLNWAYSYPDWWSWTWDVSLLTWTWIWKTMAWRKVTSSWYVLALSWWTYEDWWWSNWLWAIQISEWTKANNTQDPVNQNVLLVKWDDQDSSNFWLWIDQNWVFQWRWMVDSDSSFVTFEWLSAVSPKPFDIDWDWLLNSKEAEIFLWKNNVWDIDWDWFTDWEKDWDSDWDTFNDKLDPFPMDADRNNCTLDTKPDPNFCHDNWDWTWSLDDSVFKDSDWNWIDTDWDWLSDFLEYQFWTDKNIQDTDWDWLSDFLEYQFWLNWNDVNDATGDKDNDWITNIDEILWQYLEIDYKDVDWNSQTFTWVVLTDYLNPDTDWDWVKDWNEIINWTNPNNPDTDWDWIPDWPDPYPLDWSNNWQDITDIDWKNYSDEDDDWLPEWWEDKYTNWKNSDRSSPSDSDSVVIQNDLSNWDVSVDASWDDFWLNSWSWDTNDDWVFDPYEDFDNDWLLNIDEYKNWTNPNNWDSDWDHLNDFEDPYKNNKLDLNWDEDWDSLLNWEEIDWWKFDLKYKDSSCNDITENDKKVITKYDNKDSDLDWLFDQYEKQKWTNPLVMDTDWDWFSDNFEILIWSDPLNACSSDANAVPDDKDHDWLIHTFETTYSQCWDWTWIYIMTWSFQNWFSTEILDCDSGNDYKLIDTWEDDNPDSNNNWIYDKIEDFDNDWLTNFEEQVLW